MGGWIGTLIFIIIVISWIVRGLSALTGNGEKQQDQEQERKRRTLEDWDQAQARRRAEMAQQSGQRGMQTRVDQAADPSPDLSQMTMAERIELARQRARQQGGAQRAGNDEQAEALQRARQQADQTAQRRRQAAQNQRREQLEAQRARAARERETAARRQAAEQQARERQRELQQSRSRRRPTKRGTKPATARTAKPADVLAVVEMPKGLTPRAQRQSKQAAAQRAAQDANQRSVGLIGPLNAAALRRAFVMKEVLDKPIALRSGQEDLPS